MSVTTPTGSSGSRDKSRRKRNNPMKIDVSLNENSPSSPIDASLMTLTSNDSTPVLVIRSDSKEDSPGGSLGFPLQEPSATPVTPIFTPTASSHSILPQLPLDNDDLINVTDSTTIISTAQVFQAVENPISLSSDLNNSKDDLSKSSSSEASMAALIPEQIISKPRVLSVNIAKDDMFIRESISQKMHKHPFISHSDDKPLTLAESQKNDSYCWSCHEGGNVVCCDNCPRVFHLKCAHIESEPPEDHDWLCPICVKMRSTKRRRGETPPNLTELLAFVLKKLKFEGTDQFHQEVSEDIAPGYRELVFHPMDLGKIERNLALYEASSHLRYEVEWILHNCIIYNGTRHSLTKVARQIVKMCRTELSEIEYCANCYKLSCTRPIGWFSQVCDSPHAVVLAKVKGHPQWPGKLINKGRERYEVRFFGREHMRATVPINCVYPLKDGESPPPPSNSKTAGYWPEVVRELRVYQSNLREWLQAHPEHKLVQPDIASGSEVLLAPSMSVDKSKLPDNSELLPISAKKMSVSEELPMSLAAMEHIPSIVYPPSSDPAPIAIYASNPPVPSSDLEPGTSKFPSDIPVDPRNLTVKGPSLSSVGPERDPALRPSETASASDDEREDPSFKIPSFQPASRDPKAGGRTRKRKPGPAVEVKQQNKKIVIPGIRLPPSSSSRGRGRKIESGIRKPLNIQFPPHPMNEELNLSLKQELVPLALNPPFQNSLPVPDLMERNFNLSQKLLEPNFNLSQKLLEPKPEEEMITVDPKYSRYSKMFQDKFDEFILDLIADLNTGQEDHIQRLLDEIVSREVSNRERIYTEVYRDIREEMKQLFEQCHQVAKVEVERQSSEIRIDSDKKLDQQVRDTKKKTWCSYCWSEAYYNCCWNVNYCSEKCQKLHWVEHKPHCIQILNTPSHSDTTGQAGHRPPVLMDTPHSSRDREDSVSLENLRQPLSALPDHESAPSIKRNAAVENSREMINNEEPFMHERTLDYKSPQRYNVPSTSTVPPTNTAHHFQEKIKFEKHPASTASIHFMNSQHKVPPNTTAPIMDNSTATTPVLAKPPNFPPVNSSQMIPKEHFGHMRYASLSAVPSHHSPRGQQACPLPGVSQPLSQIKANNPSVIPNSGLAALAASAQQKDPTTPHKPEGYKRVRETVNRPGAQSPHPSAINPVMFPGPLDGHPQPPPHSFIIHPGGATVAGAPTTPTSNQQKVLQAPFHPNVGGPNIYQFMNGDLSANLMMRYPFPIANQSGLIQNQSNLQPNPHSMTPRPHD